MEIKFIQHALLEKITEIYMKTYKQSHLNVLLKQDMKFEQFRQDLRSFQIRRDKL